MRRVWINQPSTLQVLHHMDGTLALAGPYSETCDVIYPLSGNTISMVVPKHALSEGWPKRTRQNNLRVMKLALQALQEPLYFSESAVRFEAETALQAAIKDMETPERNTP
jgi:hypothetical protein